MAMAEDNSIFMIDEAYEFCAPRFFDFVSGESEGDMRRAELWFENSQSYAPSPFMPRIKTSRSVQLDTLCDFSEAEQQIQASKSAMAKESTSQEGIAKESNLEEVIAKESTPHQEANLRESTSKPEEEQTRPQADSMPAKSKEEASLTEIKEKHNADFVNELTAVDKEPSKVFGKGVCKQENKRDLSGGHASSTKKDEPSNGNGNTCAEQEAQTPAPPKASQTDTKKHQTAKKIASMIRNPSALKSRKQLQSPKAKSIKPASVKRNTNVKKSVGTPMFAQENQAIKRQKLEGGKSRQILNIKPPNFPHKTRPGVLSGNSNLCSSTAKTQKEDRKIYVREPAAAPFVSMAEMVRRFQSNTRQTSLPCMNNSLSHDDASGMIHRKPKILTLTRPKEPEFETSQRVRSVRIKSSAEIEEEMLAKMPKFKARPLNKKILEAPTLPSLPRSTLHLPEFKEFHLETSARAHTVAENAETSSVASTTSANHHKWNHLTAPKSPLLQTSLRARPPRIKTSDELEKEELEKAPKFKARPLNKKIFESKGDMGIFCNTKRQITIPQEFHFAIDERIPPPAPAVVDMFDKLSLNSEPHHDKQIPRNTTPNPFHLLTEERGAEKEKKFIMELVQKQLEEEKARVPRANPYPYTTDYPVIPPKPEPKQCTEPEPFELESLVRHEEEMQREMQERLRMEMEEAQMRIFKAQPILKEDPIPVPEKTRKPLTEVQEFNLHVDHRATDRAEFDKKVKEKETMYKRYREEAEAAKMMEEEKALKQLRRTLVPQARPVPNFANPFLPQRSSREVTKPKSPKLHVLRRKERHNGVVRTTTTATTNASCMR